MATMVARQALECMALSSSAKFSVPCISRLCTQSAYMVRSSASGRQVKNKLASLYPMRQRVPSQARPAKSLRHRVKPNAQATEETADPAASEEEEEEKAESSEAPDIAADLALRYKAAMESGDEVAIAEAENQLQAMEKDRAYLSQQLASLTDEVSLAKDRFLRLNADFDNFRKRSDREKSALAVSIRGDVIEGLLPMIDNFERAKAAIKVETEGEIKVDNSYQSIYKQLVEAMKGMGVTAVETAGKEFDPNVHEAIMREESSEVHEGFIVAEFRKGFMIGDKLLRPAMVKVSAGPGPAGGAVEGGDKSEGDVVEEVEGEVETESE